MTKGMVVRGVIALAVVGGLLALGFRALIEGREPTPVKATAGSIEAHPSLLYGRVTTKGGAAYEGRLRWGGDQEASWTDYFNGFKEKNPWAMYAPPERLLKPPAPVSILGVEIDQRQDSIPLGRFFMVRFAEITRIEPAGAIVRVTLKSGAVFDLDHYAAHDLDDGVRVWDGKGQMVDVANSQIRSVELFGSPPGGRAPARLYGTVHTPGGEFTGLLQWNRTESLASDTFDGESRKGSESIPYETIRSIVRTPEGGSLVTMLDGSEIALDDSQESGPNNKGVYVDDPRYSRVLVAWTAVERVDLRPWSGGPGYDDFPAGRALQGEVTTRAGRKLEGRIVYDLDESETSETFDAPSRGIDYTIPFGQLRTIVVDRGPLADPETARVILRSGEELVMKRSGDLGDGNAGLLVFEGGGPKAEYVAWAEVVRVDFDSAPSDPAHREPAPQKAPGSDR